MLSRESRYSCSIGMCPLGGMTFGMPSGRIKRVDNRPDDEIGWGDIAAFFLKRDERGELGDLGFEGAAVGEARELLTSKSIPAFSPAHKFVEHSNVRPLIAFETSSLPASVIRVSLV